MCSALVISEEDTTSEDPHSVEQNRNRKQHTCEIRSISRGSAGMGICCEATAAAWWPKGGVSVALGVSGPGHPPGAVVHF
jgi:hypothetical protein